MAEDLIVTLLSEITEAETSSAATTSAPKLRVPFAMSANASTTISADTVEQDSQAEVAQCVYAVLGTELGEHPTEPEFGIEDQAFRPQADLEEMASAVERWEPRAEVAFADDFDGLVETIAVGVEVSE